MPRSKRQVLELVGFVDEQMVDTHIAEIDPPVFFLLNVADKALQLSL